MGREKRPPSEELGRASSYISPNRSRTRSRSPMHHELSRSRRSPHRGERYSRTASHSRRRSHSGHRNPNRCEENVKAKKPAYGGPNRPLVLDSNIQVIVNPNRSSSPVPSSSMTRIVTVRPRGERRSRNSSSGDRGRYQRDSECRYGSPSPGRQSHRDGSVVCAVHFRNSERYFHSDGRTSRRHDFIPEERGKNVSIRDREYESPSSNRRRLSVPVAHRDVHERSNENRDRRNEIRRNGRYSHRERERSRDRRRNTSRDRRTNSSRDRRINSSRDRRSHISRNNDNSIPSSRRSAYEDEMDRERHIPARRRHSNDSRRDSDSYSYAGRQGSHIESENSQHEDEPENSANANENEENEDTPSFINGPVPVGIRPPWVPVFPYRPPIPPPMVFLPRPPFIPSVGVYPHHPPPLRPIRLIHRPPPPGMFIPGIRPPPPPSH